MSQPLPTFIEPLRFAETRRELDGTLGLERMERLAEFLHDGGGGEVVLSFAFDRDERGVPYAEMVLEAHLRLLCQRCLGPWDTQVRREARLAFTLQPEEAGLLAEYGYEPVVMARHSILLRELVEDELLLALPMVPRHEDPGCQPRMRFGDDPDGDGPEEKANPFAVLARLKTKSSDESTNH